MSECRCGASTYCRKLISDTQLCGLIDVFHCALVNVNPKVPHAVGPVGRGVNGGRGGGGGDS